jgi:hypothetical protein
MDNAAYEMLENPPMDPQPQFILSDLPEVGSCQSAIFQTTSQKPIPMILLITTFL